MRLELPDPPTDKARRRRSYAADHPVRFALRTFPAAVGIGTAVMLWGNSLGYALTFAVTMAVLTTGFCWWVSSHDRDAAWRTTAAERSASEDN